MSRVPFTRLVACLLVVAAPMLAQASSPAPAAKKEIAPNVSRAGGPTKEGGKNLRVFKGLDEERLDEAMDFISASLGVGCLQCHVKDDKAGWQFAKDDKVSKRTARKMVLMTRAINKANFKGETAVSCATCHGGRLQPTSMPPLAVLGAPRPGAPSTEKPKNIPGLAAILDHYLKAMGGKTAIEKVQTRMMKGSLDFGGGRSLPIEIQQKGPDRYLYSATTPRGVSMQGFDGKSGWISRGGKTAPMDAKRLADIRKEGDLYFPSHLQERYETLTVLGSESVDGREASTVATKGADGSREILSFDAASGLLVRRLSFEGTVLGRTSIETTYSDFRDVDGVQIPFKVVSRSPRSVQIITFSEIKQGVPLEDSLFRMPSPKP